jgi:hypothetical protein
VSWIRTILLVRSTQRYQILQRARAILIDIEPAKKGPGRPKSAEPKVIKPKRRKLSAEGRAAISAALKTRWAAKREATKPKVKKTADK